MSVSSSVGQRFSQLIQALGMSKNAFAISLDKTATVIQHLVDERNKPGFDLMNKVVDVYPNVSIEWLLRGKGPMMLSGASTPATEVAPVATPVSVAAIASKAASITPSFPTPLFAVSSARPAIPEVAASPTETTPAEPMTSTLPPPAATPPTPPGTARSPVPAPEPVAATATMPLEPLPVVPLSAPGLAASSPAPIAPPAPAASDATYLTAALHAQHLQHQLALAEQRNQHLLEQQKLILERQALMQQMLDFMRRPL